MRYLEWKDEGSAGPLVWCEGDRENGGVFVANYRDGDCPARTTEGVSFAVWFTLAQARKIAKAEGVDLIVI